MHELDEQILAFRGLSDESNDDDGIVEDDDADDAEDLDELGFGTEEDTGVVE